MGVLLLAALALGCASDLLVGAPPELTRFRKGALGALAPMTVSVGAVANAPPLENPVGHRGAAFLQPGGPIQLTEDAGTIVRRTLSETLERAGHRVVREGGEAHIAVRLEEFSVDAPRAGMGWDVMTRVKLVLRVSRRPGGENWDEVSALSERSLQSVWRPGIGTIEPVLRDCLNDLAILLAGRGELAAALAKHARKGSAG